MPRNKKEVEVVITHLSAHALWRLYALLSHYMWHSEEKGTHNSIWKPHILHSPSIPLSIHRAMICLTRSLQRKWRNLTKQMSYSRAHVQAREPCLSKQYLVSEDVQHDVHSYRTRVLASIETLPETSRGYKCLWRFKKMIFNPRPTPKGGGLP